MPHPSTQIGTYLPAGMGTLPLLAVVTHAPPVALVIAVLGAVVTIVKALTDPRVLVVQNRILSERVAELVAARQHDRREGHALRNELSAVTATLRRLNDGPPGE